MSCFIQKIISSLNLGLASTIIQPNCINIYWTLLNKALVRILESLLPRCSSSTREKWVSARADVRDTTCGVQSAVGRQGNAVLAEPVLEAWERVWARSETGSHREAEARMDLTANVYKEISLWIWNLFFFFSSNDFLNLEDNYFIMSWQALKNLKIIRYKV